VSYDAGDDRISGSGHYDLGFDAAHGFMDYLALGGDGVNRLDRTKLRIEGTVFGNPYVLDEEDLTLTRIEVIDGPVRVTRVSTATLTTAAGSIKGATALFAYRSLVVQPTKIVAWAAPAPTTRLRSSMDWSEQASGMVYYDANNPTAKTIDGVPDTIVDTPIAKWMQVSGASGSVVSVSELPAGLGGTRTTYYRDDSAIDGGDTGDQRSYGDVGFQIDNPVPGIHDALGHIYFVEGATTSVGARYEGYFDHPLQVSIGSVSPLWRLHLPLVMNGS
jgi:hypothetical protein